MTRFQYYATTYDHLEDLVRALYTEEDHEDFLNECGDPVEVFGRPYDAGRVLRLVDPIAFHCDHVEVLDNMIAEAEADPERFLMGYEGVTIIHDDEDAADPGEVA